MRYLEVSHPFPFRVPCGRAFPLDLYIPTRRLRCRSIGRFLHSVLWVVPGFRVKRLAKTDKKKELANQSRPIETHSQLVTC